MRYEAGFLGEEAKLNVEIKQKSGVTYDAAKATDDVLADFNENVAAVESNVTSVVVEEQQNKGEDASSATEKVVCVDTYRDDGSNPLRIKLYIDDENNKISSVTANTDTEKTMAESTVGLDWYEGTTQLINAMFGNGFLGPDISTLDITLGIGEGDEAVKCKLYRFIAQCELENDIDLRFIQVFTKISDKLWSALVENGEMVTVYKEDGYWHESTETFENGVMRKKTYKNDKGVSKEEIYNENGVFISYNGKRENGLIDEQKYDENGKPLYTSVVDSRNGSKQETFYENGIGIKMVLTTADYVRTLYYDKNGNISEETLDDGYRRVYHYENGVYIGSTEYHANGDVTYSEAEGN